MSYTAHYLIKEDGCFIDHTGSAKVGEEVWGLYGPAIVTKSSTEPHKELLRDARDGRWSHTGLVVTQTVTIGWAETLDYDCGLQQVGRWALARA